MTFSDAIKTCLAKFIDFKGRASRTEFWWFYLFVVLMSWGMGLVTGVQTLTNSDAQPFYEISQFLFNFVCSIPVISAGSRRLHDVNKSGWWQLLGLTIVGLIPLIIWLSSNSNETENYYGVPAIN